ncbi:tail fiber domain-containing protein, partial [Neptunomonas phycophila]|uniref:tail fiber domain-containing protein n=1 Tax=Neptunomonas phycophila TaxID=1572645 RepID=UPI0035119106
IGSGSDVEHFWNGSNYYTDINGGAVWYIRDGNSSNASRFMMDVDNGNFHADGNIYAYSTSVSDEKLKKDINKVENALDKVSQLNGYEFTYLKDNKRSAGVIAQEVEKVLPQAVGEDELMHLDGDEEKYKYVEYNQLVALLIESIKELKAEIEELKGAK